MIYDRYFSIKFVYLTLNVKYSYEFFNFFFNDKFLDFEVKYYYTLINFFSNKKRSLFIFYIVYNLRVACIVHTFNRHDITSCSLVCI